MHATTPRTKTAKYAPHTPKVDLISTGKFIPYMHPIWFVEGASWDSTALQDSYRITEGLYEASRSLWVRHRTVTKSLPAVPSCDGASIESL